MTIDVPSWVIGTTLGVLFLATAVLGEVVRYLLAAVRDWHGIAETWKGIATRWEAEAKKTHGQLIAEIRRSG